MFHFVFYSLKKNVSEIARRNLSNQFVQQTEERYKIHASLTLSFATQRGKSKRLEMVNVAQINVRLSLVGVVENVYGASRLANLHVHALSHVLIPNVLIVVFVNITRKLAKQNAVSLFC